ncbi:MAG TPA: PdaC/SigV domain-containing protein [Cyclobacteriaceae bacterium]
MYRLFNIIFIITFLIYIAGCDTSKKEDKESAERSDDSTSGESYEGLSYEMKSITEKEGNCSSTTGGCIAVEVTYPVFNLGSKMGKEINSKVRQRIIDYLNEESSETEITDVIEGLLAEYEEFKKEFPNSQDRWEMSVDAAVTHQTDKILSVSYSTNMYKGGAHPNNRIDYQNIDLEDGSEVTLEEALTDLETVTSIAEKKFRDLKKIPEDVDYAKAGFSFEGNAFALSDNFGYTENGIIFYYNTYDIAPYSEGPTRILVHYYELKGNILKVN